MQRSVATPCGNAQLEAVEIPTGEGTPVAMFSARFDGGPIEQKMRRVHKILVDNSYNALMVEVDAGESFGVLTARYLGQLKADKGLMIAVCTHHYGEMTSSEFCSFYELKFAVTHGIKVLPLRVEDTYPPQPPCGNNHLDKHRDAQGFIDMKIGPDVLYVDCRTMSEMDIACAIATRLRKLRDERQVPWVGRPGMWGFEVQFFFEIYCRIERNSESESWESFGIQKWSSTKPCSSQDRALAEVAPVNGEQHASACFSRWQTYTNLISQNHGMLQRHLFCTRSGQKLRFGRNLAAWWTLPGESNWLIMKRSFLDAPQSIASDADFPQTSIR